MKILLESIFIEEWGREITQHNRRNITHMIRSSVLRIKDDHAVVTFKHEGIELDRFRLVDDDTPYIADKFDFKKDRDLDGKHMTEKSLMIYNGDPGEFLLIDIVFYDVYNLNWLGKLIEKTFVENILTKVLADLCTTVLDLIPKKILEYFPGKKYAEHYANDFKKWLGTVFKEKRALPICHAVLDSRDLIQTDRKIMELPLFNTSDIKERILKQEFNPYPNSWIKEKDWLKKDERNGYLVLRIQ